LFGLLLFAIVEPGFYSANWLYLGKVFYQLGQKDKARHWLEKTANYHPKNEEDVQVNALVDIIKCQN